MFSNYKVSKTELVRFSETLLFAALSAGVLAVIGQLQHANLGVYQPIVTFAVPLLQIFYNIIDGKVPQPIAK
jgi:hypothetical protein